jgi:GNAT superfamily N-acetyltransferase
VRGLRVFVRPIEASDYTAVTDFLTRHRDGDSSEGGSPTLGWGLLGKLLGDIVAVVSLELAEDALRIVDITVARELRRKWIGRVMMGEVDQLAEKMDRRRIVVEQPGDAREFFRRVGFQSEGEGERWTRVI